MRGKPIPLIAQHESWVSLDPIKGCPARCAYCYLEPPGLTKQVPSLPVGGTEFIYQSLSKYQYLEKSRFSDVPGEQHFPIAIGNYTDMCLTHTNRQYLLSLLQKHRQSMPTIPVCIVTKAILGNEFLEEVNQIGITVIFFISLSFLAAKFEKGIAPIHSRLKNFSRIAQFANLHAVHFWRPVTSLSIKDEADAHHQVEQLQKHGAAISVITGLKFGSNLAEMFMTNEGNALQQFFTTQIGRNDMHDEIFEPEVQAMLLRVARESSYVVYLHTSCAVSYVLKQPDYNATFRTPHLETKCLIATCPTEQRERCFQFKSSYSSPSDTLLEQIADYLHIQPAHVSYSKNQETIIVDSVLTQEQQTFLTQATSFSVRGKALIPTLEWIGSINRTKKEISMKISDMVDMTREVTQLFDELVGPWNIYDMITELTGEVGTLADSIMIKEKRRPAKPGVKVDLEDDIVDIIFMLIRIADLYEIDLDKAYINMIAMTKAKLEKRIRQEERSGTILARDHTPDLYNHASHSH